MPLAADTFVNHYRIIRPLGAGGMGEVYVAEDTRLKRSVALKILPEEVAFEPDRRARFQREAQALASMNHPNIVSIHSIEESAGTYFLTMELVDGRNLAQAIPPEGLPVSEFLKYAIPMVDAVGAAHERGVIHRDLKPANVMIATGDRVKVLDFGIAKLRHRARATTTANTTALAGEKTMTLEETVSGDLTEARRILGSVAYMSPEQAQGKELDFTSDIFSLGIVFYEMAAGVRPFQGETSIGVAASIIKDTPKDLTEVKPSVPPELGRIVRRCLAKAPEARYQSAKELRSDLEDFARQLSAGAVFELAPRPGTRRWLPWTALAAVVILAGAYILWRSRGSARAYPPIAPTFTRVTSAAGIEREPSLSPDGNWIVYAGNGAGNQDIYLQGIGGEAAINLTKDSPVYDGMPAFSPDGRLIAFRSDRDGGGIFVMGRLGESVRRVAKDGWDPAWTPDGREIVYSTESAENPDAREAPAEVWAVNISSGERRRISGADAVQPRVSRDGKFVAFWALPVHSDGKTFAGANRDIWVQPLAGGPRVQVTTVESADYNPAWSPDGRFLYFVSDRGGSANLWRVAIERQTGKPIGNPQPITTPAIIANSIDVSADGSTIAYGAFAASTNVRAVAFDPVQGVVTGEPSNIVTGARAWLHPDLSPDGRMLTLRSWRAQEDIWVVGVDGTGLRNLTNDPARDRGSRFTRDGSILFYSNRTGGYQFWKINPDGSGLQQLTHSEVGALNDPLPSPDGLRVGATNPSTREQYIFDARDFSKPPEKLPAPPSRTGVYLRDWSPDGTRIAASETGDGIWVYDLRDKRWDRIGEGIFPRWLPDSRRLLASRNFHIALYDTQSKRIREVYSEPEKLIGSMAISRDGKRVYFTSAITQADIWLMRLVQRDH